MITKWLERLTNFGAQVPGDFKLLDFEIEKKEGEEETGKQLTPNLFDLYRTIMWLISRLIVEEKEHKKTCRGDKACLDFQRKMVMVKLEIKTVKEVFFMSVRHELEINPIDYPLIDVRKGGVIVSCPPSLEEELTTPHVGISPRLMNALKGADPTPRL